MSERFKIELPENLSDEQAASLLDDVRDLADVENAGTLRSRSIDAGSIALWVQIVADAVAVGASMVPVVSKIVELFRARKVKGAKIVLPNGTTIELDELTPELAEKLVSASKD